jgi:LysM repeat protein
MIRFVCGIAVAASLLANIPSTGWCQNYYLYAPTSIDAPGSVQGKDGVLVQDVAVQKGDTLYGLSRKFSGRGSYYPQILLFNDIKDPNKIYPGEVFKVPVSHKTAENSPVVHDTTVAPAPAAVSVPEQKPVAVATPAPVKEVKKMEVVRDKKHVTKEKTVAPSKKQTNADKQPTASTSAAQQTYENAVKAYRQDDCKTALELFDRFLNENPASPLAADASLYKAECYLKLSN